MESYSTLSRQTAEEEKRRKERGRSGKGEGFIYCALLYGRLEVVVRLQLCQQTQHGTVYCDSLSATTIRHYPRDCNTRMGHGAAGMHSAKQHLSYRFYIYMISLLTRAYSLNLVSGWDNDHEDQYQTIINTYIHKTDVIMGLQATFLPFSTL